MAYHTATEVIAECKNISVADTTGIIRTAQLASYITQTDAYIDSRLAKRYVVPITGTAALLTIKYIALYLTAGRVNDIVRKGPEQLSAEDSERISGAVSTARAMLKELEEGRAVLSDATPIKAATGAVGYDKTGSGAVILKDTVQW